MRAQGDSNEDVTTDSHSRVHPSSEILNVAHIGGCNWRDRTTYVYPGTVPYESWLAWEALRRNVYFQQDCAWHHECWTRVLPKGDWRVGSYEDIGQNKWELARFKHYNQDISKDDPQTWPVWSLTSLADVFDMVSEREAGHPMRKKKLVRPDIGSKKMFLVGEGQVAFLFDLRQLQRYRSLTEWQLGVVGKELKRLLKEFSANNAEIESVSIPQVESVIPLLQIADAMLDKGRPTRDEIARVVYPEKYRHSNLASSSEIANEDHRSANTVILKDMSKKIKNSCDLIYRQGYAGLLLKSKK